MVRSYDRHEPTAAFGLVSSNAANAILDANGKIAFLPALEDVLVWDMKRGEQVRNVFQLTPTASDVARNWLPCRSLSHCTVT